ncbi:hypothetical protein ACFL4H_00080 [Candidatus Neomarinimicrobiota bacterium]
MARKSQAEVNVALWSYSNTPERVRWLKHNQRGYDFYLNDQLRKKDKDDLRAAGMPDFIINRITPIIQTMLYFITANNPRWKAVGAEGSDVDMAGVQEDLFAHTWNLSEGKAVLSQVVLDILTKSLGWLMSDINPNMDRGLGEAIITSLEPRDIWVDPMSRDFLCRDASWILVKKRISKTQMKMLLPQFSSKIQRASGSEAMLQYQSQRAVAESESIQPDEIDATQTIKQGSIEEDEVLDYFERYEKVKQPYVHAFVKKYPGKREQALIKSRLEAKVAEMRAELKVEFKEAKLGWEQMLKEGKIIEERYSLEITKLRKQQAEYLQSSTQRLESQMVAELTKTESQIFSLKVFNELMTKKVFSSSVIDKVDFYKTKVKVTTSYGDKFLYEKFRKEEYYPMVGIPFMHTGTPYPMSAVVPMIGKQEEINKAHQIMIHNANLSSNLRWMFEKGAVNKTHWEQYSSSAGALLEYNQGFEKPTPIMPQAINNAFYTITQEGKADIEYIAGISSEMMGIRKTTQPEPYRSTIANDEFGTRRIKAWVNAVFDPALEHFGRVHRQTMQGHYTIEKTIRIVEPNNGGGFDEKKTTFNKPLYNKVTGKKIGKWLDLETSNFDIRIVSGSTLPVNRWALLDEYFKWFQAGLVDDIAVLEQSDIRGKEGIIERNSLVNRLKGKVDELEESLKDKEGDIETLSRQLIQSGIKLHTIKSTSRIDQSAFSAQAQLKYLTKASEVEQKLVKENPPPDSPEEVIEENK